MITNHFTVTWIRTSVLNPVYGYFITRCNSHSALLGKQTLHHLHHLHFSVGLAGIDVVTVLNQVLQQLARGRGTAGGGASVSEVK